MINTTKISFEPVPAVTIFIPGNTSSNLKWEVEEEFYYLVTFGHNWQKHHLPDIKTFKMQYIYRVLPSRQLDYHIMMVRISLK